MQPRWTRSTAEPATDRGDLGEDSPVSLVVDVHDLHVRFGLGGEADRVTAGFSHGMSRRMSVLLAAFHRPDVLLLDEPFDGVDPLGVEATMDLVREARLGGAAV